MNKKKEKSAIVKAMELLNYKIRTEKELRDRLGGYGYSSNEIENAIRYVKSFGYVDDIAYAEQYAALWKNKKSRSAILNELLRKGIGREEAGKAVELISEDESDTAYGILVKKAGKSGIPDEKSYAKYFRFLSGRGFKPCTVYKALEKLKNKADM